MAVKFQVGAEIKTVPEKEEIDRKINEQTSQIANLQSQIGSGGSGSGMSNDSANLLCDILRMCVTENNQLYSIEQLRTLLTANQPIEPTKQLSTIVSFINGIIALNGDETSMTFDNSIISLGGV